MADLNFDTIHIILEKAYLHKQEIYKNLKALCDICFSVYRVYYITNHLFPFEK